MSQKKRIKDTYTETVLSISNAICDEFCSPCPYAYDDICSDCKVYAIMQMIDDDFRRVNEK